MSCLHGPLPSWPGGAGGPVSMQEGTSLQSAGRFFWEPGKAAEVRLTTVPPGHCGRLPNV